MWLLKSTQKRVVRFLAGFTPDTVIPEIYIPDQLSKKKNRPAAGMAAAVKRHTGVAARGEAGGGGDVSGDGGGSQRRI